MESLLYWKSLQTLLHRELFIQSYECYPGSLIFILSIQVSNKKDHIMFMGKQLEMSLLL